METALLVIIFGWVHFRFDKLEKNIETMRTEILNITERNRLKDRKLYEKNIINGARF